MTDMPLPLEVWKEIVAFLEGRRTGEILIQVKDGEVLGFKVTKTVRVKQPVA